MATPQDPIEFALVMKALTSGLSNCVEWISEKMIMRVNEDFDMRALPAQDVIGLLIAFVSSGGTVEQVRETRPEYAHRSYYYKAVVPHAAFPSGLFVEMELEARPDPDVPIVYLLNAHPQRN